MAGRTKGEISLVLQKHIEDAKINGVKILMGENIEVLKEKIVSKANFLLKVYLKDTTTNHTIRVNLDVLIR